MKSFIIRHKDAILSMIVIALVILSMVVCGK